VKPHAINPGEISQGLDRQNLTQLDKRFVAINMNRLERLRNALSERQRPVLDALPLLFHTNHPMMPGFVSRETPSRLCDYTLGKPEMVLGRRIARSFTASLDMSQPESIYALYIMGSVGTIAQSEKSDLDIWLCVKPGLAPNAIASLNEKAKRISTWAMTFRLEVHFFLMDHEAFKQGHIDSLNDESSGSAQRLLLLDEFYRTAILVGGRKPLWWFVPANQENDYAQYTHTLLTKRFLRDDNLLDFGGIATIPDGEFVGAGIWQLYKAIESPYKSVLKLLSLEAYAGQHPNVEPLSLRFKAHVYAGELDINELDGYMMIFRHIEQYLLTKNATTRLELARRCFYFKVNKPLSKPPRSREKSWQRCLLERLTHEWGWQKQQIAMLDQRAHWKANDVTEERALLVNELNHSYRFIQDFATETGAVRAISTEELTILGRKLQATFERRPGKVEWINPNISDDLSEEIISLTERYDNDTSVNVWTAYSHISGSALSSDSTAIKSTLSLIELLLWCYVNGIISENTSFDVQHSPSISDVDVRKILAQLAQWLPLPLPSLSHKHFKQAAAPTHALLLLNVGRSPTSRLDGLGIQRLSGQADALRYSGFKDNLVVSLDMITRNSWDEISARRFDSKHALLEALQEYLQLCLPGTHQTPPSLSITCIGAHHTTTITNRIQRWFNEISHCYYSGRYPATTRYLFEMAGAYYSLQFRGPKLLIREHKTRNLLIDYLGEEQLAISPILFDSRALESHPMRTISHTISGGMGGRNWSGAIHIFYRRYDIGMEVYVVDEMGSITHREYHGSGEHSPLKPLHQFLRAIIERQTRLNQQLLYDFGIFPLHFYELIKTGPRFKAAPKLVSRQQPATAKFEVKAVAHKGSDGELVFDFYCDDQEFLGRTFNHQLYMVVAQYILKLRTSREHYAVYLTDLDLSLCIPLLSDAGRLTSGHYLKLKDRLEFRLNHAIGILLKT